MRIDIIRELYKEAVCMMALPIAIIITLVQEMLFFAAETFGFLGRKVKSLNILLGLKLERLLSEPPHKPRSRVKIDAWGGTSVDPSEVFRTEQGKKDLEAMSEIGKRQGLRRGRTWEERP